MRYEIKRIRRRMLTQKVRLRWLGDGFLAVFRTKLLCFRVLFFFLVLLLLGGSNVKCESWCLRVKKERKEGRKKVGKKKPNEVKMEEWRMQQKGIFPFSPVFPFSLLVLSLPFPLITPLDLFSFHHALSLTSITYMLESK